MEPTYSFAEIKSLIRTLDFSSLTLLQELVEEERERYTEHELKAFLKFLQLKNKPVVRSEVKAEFLLSYN